MSTGIFIIHTPGQLEQASNLVDLLEASLSLPNDAILCSSLPGYAWSARTANGSERPAKFSAALDRVGAAIALVDASSVRDPQLCFDLAAAWARGKRIALLADTKQRRLELPEPLAATPLATRVDRSSVVSMVEDLAFDLGLSPRIGQDAYHALEQLSSFPPPADDTNGSFENTKTEPVVIASALRIQAENEPIEYETQASPIPHQLLIESARPTEPDPDDELDLDDDDALQLSEADVELSELREEPLLADEALGDADLEEEALAEDEAAQDALEEEEPLRADECLHERPSQRPTPLTIVSCELSLEAGRAISECSFHRDAATGDFGAELENNFGRFIDAVGGNWGELRRIGDLDVWLGATDNLLETLPVASKYICEWYELGFQFSMLRSLAEQGVPLDGEQRAAYEELWTQSMDAFRQSASSARISPRETRRVQGLLENLIGPEPRRDFANVARSLNELRALAEQADRV